MKRKKIIFFISFFVSISLVLIFAFGYYNFYYPVKYKEYINKYAQEYNLQSELVASVINVESGFDKNAKSNKGAIGLMQILPSTGKYIASMLNEDFAINRLYDPETNIKYGCFYLNYLNKKFKDCKISLCAYNAGENTVFLWLKNDSLSKDGINLDCVPYKITANYVKKIMRGTKFYINRV
ncbi:MAG: lytic transglycosylase domain-containing protein [Clostridia bacterium]|nr:lytic transglycosylase domain-containing protein [Clostridia bacterium]